MRCYKHPICLFRWGFKDAVALLGKRREFLTASWLTISQIKWVAHFVIVWGNIVTHYWAASFTYKYTVNLQQNPVKGILQMWKALQPTGRITIIIQSLLFVFIIGCIVSFHYQSKFLMCQFESPAAVVSTGMNLGLKNVVLVEFLFYFLNTCL